METSKSICSLEQLKKMSVNELNEQAQMIRNFIIENVSKTGGHLSANLGVVELVVAMHYVFDSPKDKFIFDVGHQVYAHKIITERKDKFYTLRKLNGLSGFPSMNESVHDCWESGHSSTSIGALLGFLEAKKTNENIGELIAIIGDGSIQNGLSLAALNLLAAKKNEKAIIVLNDNEMSISKNVGGLSDFFNKLRIKKSYNTFRKITPKFIRNTFKMLVYKNDNMFTNLGFKYFGPIDGHDIKSLIKYFEFAKKYDKSIILHVKTIKGKGYLPSEIDCVGKWHGVGSFDIQTGEQNEKQVPNFTNWSTEVGRILLEEVKKDNRIKIISPAMMHGSGLDLINEIKPSSIIDVGINEENACIMAAAMSQNGLVPIVSIYSTFLQRSYDILNNDINRTNTHVVFLVDRAGIISGDGSTHQGIYDLAFTTHLDNFIITMPRNLYQLEELVKLALSCNNPFIIRYPKSKTKLEYSQTTSLSIFKWEIVKEISKINIITYGDDVNEFEKIIENRSIGLINALFIKPLDIETLKKLNNTTLVIYEQVVEGGSLGMMIASEIINLGLNINLKRYFVKRSINCLGSTNEIKNSIGLNIEKIIEEICGD